MLLEDAELFELLGNGRWTFAEIFCNFTKKHVLIKGDFNKDPVFCGQMFLVSRNQARHKVLLSCGSETLSIIHDKQPDFM